VTENLKNILSAGESSFVEFKEEKVHPGGLAKEMAAFANTEGGSIYLGISDDGKVMGITRKDVEEWVFSISKRHQFMGQMKRILIDTKSRNILKRSTTMI
jgi:ATP-dependent DNA helicase RecG